MLTRLVELPKTAPTLLIFSVKKVDPPGEKKKLDGQMTDAGGGGTGKSFLNALEKVERTKIDENLSKYSTYLDATCSLHAHNLTLKNPITLHMEERGLNKRNCL